mgnify:FL=1
MPIAVKRSIGVLSADSEDKISETYTNAVLWFLTSAAKRKKANDHVFFYTSGTKDKMVSVWISEAAAEKVATFAEKSGYSKRGIVLTACIEYLRHKEALLQPKAGS